MCVWEGDGFRDAFRFPDDPPRGEGRSGQFVFVKDGEFAKRPVRIEDFVAVGGVLEGVGNRCNVGQPGEVREEAGLAAGLHDGEEVQVGIFVQAVTLQPDGAEPDQGAAVAAARGMRRSGRDGGGGGRVGA